MIIFCRIFLSMRNISDKSYRENQNVYFMFSNFFSEIGLSVRSCGKCIRAEQIMEYCMVPVLCMLDS